MKQKFYTFLFVMAFLAPNFLAAQSILYISRNSPADGNDPAVIAGLENLGYTVTPISAGEFTATSHEIFGPDLIFFGEYLSSSGVTPFAEAGFPTPCVSLEGYAPRSNRWALLASDDDFGQIREDVSFGIAPEIPKHYTIDVVEEHPIFTAAGINVGESVLWSTEDTALPEVVWFDLPQATATAVANINGETDLATFWTLEPDANDDTNPLQHRLVLWGLHDNGLAEGTTTDEFWSIIDNSIKWSLDMLDTGGGGGGGGDRESLLYIARNNPPDGNDPAVITGLEGLGYTVTAIGADEFTSSSHEIFGPDLIFFGEYLSSSGVTPFAEAGFPTPCVSYEGYAPRGNRWALLASDDDFGQIREDVSFGIAPRIPDHYTIDIIENHPIFTEAGLSAGESVLWSTEDTALPEVVWFNLPQAGATALANINGETDLATFWAIEPDANDDTNPLQHRLVLWGLHDNGLAEGAATAEFWAITDNSIQWALGNLVSNTKEVNILEAGLTISPNPFNTTTQISFDLKESANVELRVFDALGQLVTTNQEQLSSGTQVINFTPNNLQKGVYFISVYADGLLAGSGKMIIK